MFKIPKIEKESFYIDQAMNSMQTYATKERQNIEDRFEKNKNPRQKDKSSSELNLNKRKDLELQKIRFLNDTLQRSLKKVISQFPKFKQIDPIYLKLIDTTPTRVEHITDALQRLLWIINTIDEFTLNNEVKIKRARTSETVGFIMKKYLGRVNSLFRKNKDFFRTLDDARKFMNKMPTFLNIYTVAIAGFPNVGKSTLMNKVTGSDVEIQNYPFTTKGLMFGYIKQSDSKIVQLIDTPGLLGRDKNNQIEERAQIIISQHSDFIIYVIDFTESCGYSIENQIKLLKKTKAYNNPTILYLSKTDMYDQEDIERKEEYKTTLKKYKVFEDSEELKAYIIENQTKNKKFDIRKINVIK
jgi:nucleolar GTP-binding protein